MGEWIAPTTEILQQRIIAEADEQTLILTSGGRLARHLHHAFRMDRMKKDQAGWLPPRILSLNAWLEETWRQSWPEESLASSIQVLKTWEAAVQGTDLPDGLAADLQLYRILDETYRVKIRDKLPSPQNNLMSPLISWREEVFSHFRQQLRDTGRLHPASLPLIVHRLAQQNSLALPEKIHLAGFEYPAPIERDLLEVLKMKYGALETKTQLLQDPHITAFTLDHVEEEIFFLVEELLAAAQEVPLHQIAVLSPNLDLYGPKLSMAFQEVIGPSVTEKAGLYNISLGQPLQKHPMVQAGLLPLRFVLEGEPRTLLISLLLSPYYSLWQPFRSRLAQADRIWRRQSVDSDSERLLRVLRLENFENLGGEIWESLFQPFTKRKQSGSEWVKALQSCWQKLGFPFLTLPGEEGLYLHLLENLETLALDLKEEILTAADFCTWLNHLLGQTLVNEPGYEQAGIQVLGLIEARGLAFEKLFLVGLSEGSLPQPTRSFPFLQPEERKRVQGATPESQYAFAQMTFNHIKTSSPRIILTRPGEEKGEKLLPSPFWPDESRPQGKGRKNFWFFPGKVWLRAEWVRQAFQGIQQYPLEYPSPDEVLTPSPVPATISATAVEMALSCPLKYFMNIIVGLAPLEKIELGIPPMEKGTFIHRILASFTKRIRETASTPNNWDAVYPFLERLIETQLGGSLEDPHWQVEKRRLIGDGQGDRGLFGRWLEQEQERLAQGWQWTREEVAFHGLQGADWPLAVQGRIDRVDLNPRTKQAACWDYKSGSLPPGNDLTQRFLQPQLPLYLLALKKQPNLLESTFGSMNAGYICLRSEADCRHWDPLKESTLWGSLIDEWERIIGGLGRKLAGGTLGPDPNPKPEGRNLGACRNCDYSSLCPYWKKDRYYYD
jgi:ATP-dependent helicase/nuclease subunit B